MRPEGESVRRLALITVLLAAAGLALTLTRAGTSQASRSFTVDAIFDNAAFLTPGSDVRIAGANVGTVESISLTAGRKARLRLSIDRRFAPFHRDAECTIQPQSLIGEKFVQCSPGTPQAPAVTAVPLTNTHAPVDLDLVLGPFSQPTTARLALILDALGNGLSGRGQDLNAALRRANPALQQTHRLLAQLVGERRTIQELTDEANRVVGTLAQRREDVARFVSESAHVLATSGRRRAELGQTLRRIPPLLDEATPTLRQLTAATTVGTPVLAALDRSAAPLTRAVNGIAPFVDQVRPTLPALQKASSEGRRTARVAAPQVRRVARLARATQPIARDTAALLTSSEDEGAIDGVLHFVYYATAALARYDATTHILPAFPLVAGLCNLYATTTVSGCDAHFAAGRVRATASRQRHRNPGTSTPATAVKPTRTHAPPPAPMTPPAGLLNPVTKVIDTLVNTVDPGGQAAAGIDHLLGGLTGGRAPGADPREDGSPAGLGGLLDYLLGSGS
jgi:virulence factor Mce-like protein